MILASSSNLDLHSTVYFWMMFWTVLLLADVGGLGVVVLVAGGGLVDGAGALLAAAVLALRGVALRPIIP